MGLVLPVDVGRCACPGVVWVVDGALPSCHSPGDAVGRVACKPPIGLVRLLVAVVGRRRKRGGVGVSEERDVVDIDRPIRDLMRLRPRRTREERQHAR